MKELRYLENVVTLQVDGGKCTGCGICPTVCPHGLLQLQEGKIQVTDRDRCMECGACAGNCPAEAISVKAGVGCASAIIYGWLTGKEPSCDCGGGSSCC